MLGAQFMNSITGPPGSWKMTPKREKLEVPVVARLGVSKYRTLEVWCQRSLRKRSEMVGIVLERVLEIYEQEAVGDEPVEHFVRRLHLREPP